MTRYDIEQQSVQKSEYILGNHLQVFAGERQNEKSSPDDEAFELILTLGTLDFKRFVILKTPFRMPIGCQSPQSSIKSYILQIRFSIGPREFIPRGFNL